MAEQILELSQDNNISNLENALNMLSKTEDIETLFIDYCKSKFLNRLISQHLIKISKDNQYVAPYISEKLSLRVINNEKFSYSVRLHLPDKEFQTRTKETEINDKELQTQIIWTGNSHRTSQTQTIWTGDSQILVIKGTGSCKIRILKLPVELDINNFKSGILCTKIEEKILKGGDSISNWNSHQVIEIVEVYETVVIETLTINNPMAELHWTFDHNLKSVNAFPSKALLSRLMTFVSLAIEMELNIPQQLYNTIFELGDPLTKFRAIEAMLLEGHPSAIDYLQMAIESPIPILSNLSQNLYNKLLASQ